MTDVERVEYAKLVRDRIPEIIRSSGAVPVTRILNPDDFLAAALSKVVEEAAELRVAQAADRLDELADLWEVLDAVIRATGNSWGEVRARADEKRLSRGGFSLGVWLEAVERPVQ